MRGFFVLWSYQMKKEVIEVIEVIGVREIYMKVRRVDQSRA